ncbi:hypothetical protein SNE510_72480 [Streptomyces sp. NE5-10]|uniref:hypothetical protein n=1 Tax=Streptomyces sp. NE5-10 TaxID=2759674 RepID=UPI001908CFA0|nr:hypothetical protein [Streptomyces sp. NE5-10]GHJ97729.1 hypothetical protein SNE510_72480 [Streptomyces sp. NE5-10]
MTHTPTPPTPPTPESEGPGGLLTVHATLVLLAAAFIGAVAGVLTSFSTGNTAAALLAGLTACGVSIPVLHRLIHP